jgi:hypothetical protein
MAAAGKIVRFPNCGVRLTAQEPGDFDLVIESTDPKHLLLLGKCIGNTSTASCLPYIVDSAGNMWRSPLGSSPVTFCVVGSETKTS